MRLPQRGKLSRREFGLGLAFIAAAGTAALGRPTRNVDLLGKSKLKDVIPEQIGSWTFVSSSGLVLPPEDQLSRLLYSQLLTRVYSRPDGTSIMLLIAQSGTQTGILQIHRPEVCYSAGGSTLSGMTRHPLQLPWGKLPTIALVATAADRTEQIVYWTRIGHHLPLSWLQQREAVAIDNLHGIIPDAVLVRVSMIDNDTAGAVQIMDDFIRDMFTAVTPATRQFLIG